MKSKNKQAKPKNGSVFGHLDLRSVTRNPEQSECIVLVGDNREQWLTLGEVSISQKGGDRERGVYTVEAYLSRGATDFEHDSAYAFRFDVIGLSFEGTRYGGSSFKAYLHPDSERFRVPSNGDDPFEDAEDCEHCADGDERHVVVSRYVPPENPELFGFLRDKILDITVGVTSKEDGDA